MGEKHTKKDKIVDRKTIIKKEKTWKVMSSSWPRSGGVGTTMGKGTGSLTLRWSAQSSWPVYTLCKKIIKRRRGQQNQTPKDSPTVCQICWRVWTRPRTTTADCEKWKAMRVPDRKRLWRCQWHFQAGDKQDIGKYQSHPCLNLFISKNYDECFVTFQWHTNWHTESETAYLRAHWL